MKVKTRKCETPTVDYSVRRWAKMRDEGLMHFVGYIYAAARKKDDDPMCHETRYNQVFDRPGEVVNFEASLQAVSAAGFGEMLKVLCDFESKDIIQDTRFSLKSWAFDNDVPKQQVKPLLRMLDLALAFKTGFESNE